MKLSKPKLTKCRASELWMCEGGYITYAPTPEEAYNDWLVKEKAEPYRLYSKRSMKELIVRRPSAPEPPEHIDRGVTVGTWVPKWFSKLFGGSV